MPHLDRRPTLNMMVRPDRDRVIGHPDDVLRSDLTTVEKRAILASWTSDAHAVPDRLGFRQLDDGGIVPIDDVLGALRALNEADAAPPSRQTPVRPRRRPRSLLRSLRVPLARRDDDDDPPPTPAASFPLGMELALRRKWEGAAEPDPLAA